MWKAAISLQDNNSLMQMCTLIRTELVDSITEFASDIKQTF